MNYKPFEGYNPTRNEIVSQMGKDVRGKIKGIGVGMQEMLK